MRATCGCRCGRPAEYRHPSRGDLLCGFAGCLATNAVSLVGSFVGGGGWAPLQQKKLTLGATEGAGLQAWGGLPWKTDQRWKDIVTVVKADEHDVSGVRGVVAGLRPNFKEAKTGPVEDAILVKWGIGGGDRRFMVACVADGSSTGGEGEGEIRLLSPGMVAASAAAEAAVESVAKALSRLRAGAGQEQVDGAVRSAMQEVQEATLAKLAAKQLAPDFVDRGAAMVALVAVVPSADAVTVASIGDAQVVLVQLNEGRVAAVPETATPPVNVAWWNPKAASGPRRRRSVATNENPKPSPDDLRKEEAGRSPWRGNVPEDDWTKQTLARVLNNMQVKGTSGIKEKEVFFTGDYSSVGRMGMKGRTAALTSVGGKVWRPFTSRNENLPFNSYAYVQTYAYAPYAGVLVGSDGFWDGRDLSKVVVPTEFPSRQEDKGEGTMGKLLSDSHDPSAKRGQAGSDDVAVVYVEFGR